MIRTNMNSFGATYWNDSIICDLSRLKELFQDPIVSTQHGGTITFWNIKTSEGNVVCVYRMKEDAEWKILADSQYSSSDAVKQLNEMI